MSGTGRHLEARGPALSPCPLPPAEEGSASGESWTRLFIAEALAYQGYLVVQLDAVLLADAALGFVHEGRDVCGRGVAGVDQEVAVLVENWAPPTW